MKKIVLIISAALISHTSVFSQVKRKCSTHDKYLERVAKDPSLVLRRAQIEQQTQDWISNESASKTNTVVTVPVVVHVLYQNGTAQNISTPQIQSQITVLNADYSRTNADTVNTPVAFRPLGANVGIQFCLATIDPSGNPTTGIERKLVSVAQIGNGSSYYSSTAGGLNAWDHTKYLNIWICDIDGGQTLGFAYLPGTTGAADDGVVIDYNFFGTIGTVSTPYDLGRTATHEVGHWFNMEHIWGDESACAADDGVTDTPQQKAENYGCPAYPQTTQAGGRCLTSDPSSMFMNYMDYSDDNCMNIFTTGQKSRMQAALNTQRTGLITSNGCSSSTSIKSFNSALSVSVYPNPSTGVFEINVGKTQMKVDLKINDLLGKTIYEKTYLPSENLVFDISTLPSGVYFAVIAGDGKVATKKIIKN